MYIYIYVYGLFISYFYMCWCAGDSEYEHLFPGLKDIKVVLDFDSYRKQMSTTNFLLIFSGLLQ